MGVRHILIVAFLLTVTANAKYRFWYIYATNGNYGILLDMIIRPSDAAIRAAIYNVDAHVQPVFWDFYSLDQVNFTGDSVFIGKNQLTPELINVMVHNVSIVGQFLAGPMIMHFMQNWEEKVLPYLLPKIPILKSQYGTIHELVAHDVHFSNRAMAYTTYNLKDLPQSRWLFISALEFNNTDLSIELAAIPFGSILLGTGYLLYQQRVYVLNNPFANIAEVKFTNPGISQGDNVLFGARINIINKLTLSIECTAKKNIIC